MKKILYDTNILIDSLRGRKEAQEFIEEHNAEALISSITKGELYVGVKKGDEEKQLAEFLKFFTVIPVTSEISKQAGLYSREYRKSHNVYLLDAIIAMTATIEQADLVTLNSKHFPMIKNLIVPYK